MNSDSEDAIGLSRVEELFIAAQDWPPEHRAALLKEACRDDATLEKEVISLLEASDRAEHLLDALDAAVAAALLRESSDVLAPRMVGKYTIISEIGRGGMGVVYLAERTDGQFEQRVALKLIKRGMDSDAILRRFLTERQILARLTHPNVARLLDGGMTEEGQPYFAMEYVDGLPITEYCERENLDVEDRLSLFEDVCGAVSYAHQNLVVHRDLKPSNILVTSDRQVKLLDFGVAKLLASDTNLSETITAAPVLTPAYAAPEQLLGLPITTSADIYALGVVLHELLTGTRPFPDDDKVGWLARLRTSDEPVPKPSGVNHLPERRRRRLAGDLDTIIQKALRSEPDRRYASVEGLRTDLHRHLAGLPVGARRDTLAYRTGKFIRRHRLGVGAMALVLVSLGLGLGVAVWQMRQASREARKADAVKDYVLSLFEQAIPENADGQEITLRDLVSRGAERLETELADQPDVRAEMLGVLGSVHARLELFPEAERLLTNGLVLRERLYGASHPEVSESLYQLGVLSRSRGDFDRAEDYLRRALQMRRSTGNGADEESAEILASLASLTAQVGKNEESLKLNEEHLELRRRLHPPDHPEIAAALAQFGRVHYRMGAYDEAEKWYREALAILQQQEHPRGSSLMGVLMGLSAVLQDKGAFDDAELLSRRVVETARSVYGPVHSQVATALHSLARVHKMRGDEAMADTTFIQALEVYRAALGENHLYVGVTMHDLGSIRISQKEYQEAADFLWASLRIFRESVGDDHAYVAMNLNTLGRLYAESGAHDRAESLFRQAIDAYHRALPPDHPAAGTSLHELGELLLVRNRPAEAEPLLRQVVERWSTAFAPDDPRLVDARRALEDCLRALGKTEDQGD